MSERERKQVRLSDGRKVRRAYVRAAGLIAVPLAFITLLPSLLGLYLIQQEVDTRVQERQQTTYALCLSGKQNRDSIRAILTRARNATPARERTPEEQERVDAFYDAILGNPKKGIKGELPLIKCRPPGGRPIPATTGETDG